MDELLKQFRLIVRNYSKASGISISETANLMMPGFLKACETAIRKSFEDLTVTEALNYGFNDAVLEHQKGKSKDMGWKKSDLPTIENNRFQIYRWDDNPTNRTYQTWVRMTGFNTLSHAEDFVKRASSPTQILRIIEEF